jgi:hypothetical protein
VRLTGTLHVSLPTEIIQLFGTGSVPVLVGGTVLGVFELGERFASQRAKDDLSKWLLTFDVQKAKALPDGTQELFERIFGERHFSLKCFVRSAAFSLGAMVFVAMLCVLIRPRPFFQTEELSISSVMSSVLIRLSWSIIVDYISLFKTRVILRIMTRMHLTTLDLAIAILLVDYFVYLVIFAIGITLHDWLFAHYYFHYDMPMNFGSRFVFWFTIVIVPPPLTESLPFFFIYFWSGFVPSIWMWLYVLALFVTRGLLRSEKLVNWLRYFLDVEKAPFRSIGAVAATLSFIASVAIILVSAEVSRIGAAS